MHTALLNNQAIPPTEPLAVKPALRWRAVSDAPGLRVGRAPELITMAPSTSSPDLQVGDSLRCTVPEMGECQGSVVWISPGGQVVLWHPAEDVPPCLLPTRWLMTALTQGEAVRIANEPLFESLARAALARV